MISNVLAENDSVEEMVGGYYYYVKYIKDHEFPVYCRRKAESEAVEEVSYA